MFKGLRDRLKKVSEDLEDELEKQLEAQLEEELARDMAGSPGGAAPSEVADAAQVSDAPTHEDASETPEPAPQPTADPDVVDQGTEMDDIEEEAAPGPRRSPPPEPVEDGAEEEEEHAAAEKDADRPPHREEAPSGAEKETGPADDATPPGPAPQASAETEAAATETKEQPAKTPEPPTKAEAAPAQAKGPGGDRGAAAQAPITGRRNLSPEEVQARLERELGEAVEVQREVEKAAGTGVGRFTINEDVLEDILWELEVALLESDVALPVIEAIKENVKEQLLSMTIARGSPHEIVEKVLRSAIRRVLEVGAMDFDAWVRDRLDEKKPVVVMFVGVNGTGKTTSIARIAHRLQEAGISSVMAAGDTFRAGAIEQLAQHGDKLGIRVVKHKQGADPAAVAYDAVEHAKARHKDVVLLDTAGRMQTNRNLMDEMEKVRRVAKPDLVVFVGDSLAGNDAVEQARQFDEVVDIDGAILTKVDVDAKGGAALSVAYTINKPLLFIGVGQGYADLEPFDADKMVARLFGSEADE